MSTPTTEFCLLSVAERLGVFVENEAIGITLREAESAASIDVTELADLQRRQQRVRSILLPQLRALFERLETVH